MEGGLVDVGGAPLSGDDPAALRRDRALVAAMAVLVALVFFLTDHRHDSIGLAPQNPAGESVTALNPWSTGARLLLAAVGAGLGALHLRRQPRIGIVEAAWCLWLAYLASTSLWSEAPLVSLRKAAVVGVLAVAAFGVARRFSTEQLTRILGGAVIIWFVAGVARELVAGNPVPFAPCWRMYGTSGPNQIGAHAALVVLTAAPVAVAAGSRRVRGLAGAAVAAGVLFLLLARSLGAWVSLTAGLVAVGLVLLMHRDRVGAALLAAGSLAVAPVAWLVLRCRWTAVEVVTVDRRRTIWDESLDSLDGVAGGSLLGGRGFAASDVERSLEPSVAGPQTGGAHNVYVDLLLDGGIPAVLLFVLPLALAAVLVVRARSPRLAAISLGVVAFAAVHGLVESMFKLPTFMLFALMTVTLSAGAEAERTASRPPAEPAVI